MAGKKTNKKVTKKAVPKKIAKKAVAKKTAKKGVTRKTVRKKTTNKTSGKTAKKTARRKTSTDKTIAREAAPNETTPAPDLPAAGPGGESALLGRGPLWWKTGAPVDPEFRRASEETGQAPESPPSIPVGVYPRHRQPAPESHPAPESGPPPETETETPPEPAIEAETPAETAAAGDVAFQPLDHPAEQATTRRAPARRDDERRPRASGAVGSVTTPVQPAGDEPTRRPGVAAQEPAPVVDEPAEPTLLDDDDDPFDSEYLPAGMTPLVDELTEDVEALLNGEIDAIDALLDDPPEDPALEVPPADAPDETHDLSDLALGADLDAGADLDLDFDVDLDSVSGLDSEADLDALADLDAVADLEPVVDVEPAVEPAADAAPVADDYATADAVEAPGPDEDEYLEVPQDVLDIVEQEMPVGETEETVVDPADFVDVFGVSDELQEAPAAEMPPRPVEETPPVEEPPPLPPPPPPPPPAPVEETPPPVVDPPPEPVVVTASQDAAPVDAEPPSSPGRNPLIVTVLVGLNYPMRLLPASTRVIVDWVAWSLIFWVPVVWVIAILVVGQ